MNPRLARWVAGAVLRDMALALLALSSLLVGVELAVKGSEGDVLALIEGSLQSAAPFLPAPAAFLGATFALGRLERERAFAALAAVGVPLRRAAVWVLLGALPAVLAAWFLSAFPPLSPGSTAASAHLRSGGLLVGEQGERALILEDEALLVGTAAGAGAHLELAVEERWQLAGARPELRRPTSRESWTGERRAAPPSLARLSGKPDVLTLLAWSEQEPGRRDLAHARLAVLAAGPRVVALLLLGLGFWLRPSPGGFARRALLAAALALLYIALDTACESLGRAEALAPAVAAFGPPALASLVGVLGVLRCERP